MSVANTNTIDLTAMKPIFDQYQKQRGALIPILQKTQGIYGYLPIEALQLIAEQLGIAVGKVYGVATFYSQFYLERRGKHELKLCDGTACHVKGKPILMSAIEGEYGIGPGETTDDGNLTLEIVYCMGSCALAPVAVVDGEVMGRLRQDKLLRELKKRLA